VLAMESAGCLRPIASDVVELLQYWREGIRNVHSGVGAVERELSKLERSGLVSVQRIGNQKHYTYMH
jgi:predicted transcriptional regulator